MQHQIRTVTEVTCNTPRWFREANDRNQLIAVTYHSKPHAWIVPGSGWSVLPESEVAELEAARDEVEALREEIAQLRSEREGVAA